MKINKRLFFIGLLLSATLLAQNTNQALIISNTFSDAHNFKMKIAFDLSSPQQSALFLQLPSGIKATPITVFLEGKELWLKQTESVPQKQDILHWSRKDNGILFLVAKGTQIAGRLQFQLQTFMPGNVVDTARVEIREIQQKVGQGFNPGTVIGSTQLFSKKIMK
jgi:hypothetical protein